MPEIISINQADQFVPGHSAYECGYYAVAMVTSMAPVGKSPVKSPGQISADAQSWYAADHGGDNSAANQDGMSLEQLYNLLNRLGIKYEPLTSIDQIRQAVGVRGHPVIFAGAETGFFDLGLGGRIPYPWTPQGNHVIVITGLDGGNFLVRDSANIAPPNILRPGPRVYDASKLQPVSITEIIPPFATSPAFNVPAGWKDDGVTLTAPNTVPVVKGFRHYILTHKWNPDDIPLKPEYMADFVIYHNPSVGGGSAQPFKYSYLWWTPAKGVVNEPELGSEINALLELAAKNLDQSNAAKQKILTFLQQAYHQLEGV
jgi:hypothetical protein